jgi:hypothetical protein
MITKKKQHTHKGTKAHNVQHTNKVTDEHDSMADIRPTWLDNKEGYYRFRPKAAKRGVNNGRGVARGTRSSQRGWVGARLR